MANQTISKEFYLYAFFSNGENQPPLSIVFLFIYLVGVTENLFILTVIYNDVQLHTPMYFFLCNLAFVDISLPTTILPKLIDILFSGNNLITFIQCFTQMYFFVVLAGIEVIVLSSMAYDRYVAICKPLSYHLIMNRRVCVLLIIWTWISGFVNSSLFTNLASKMPFCQTNKINHVFCDVKALAEISCDVTKISIFIYVENVLFALIPFSLNLISYINIIHSILQIKSQHGRKKTFSTCSSHLTVLMLFYGAIVWMYMSPPSKSNILEPVLSMLYTVVTPMLNPLIYSLRNKEVKTAVKRIMKRIIS
ncbi:olfactory receptor-like protein OLF3 [Xenopus laevis]|uniref:Olfactory receptor n=2 Tax=Xenopus laevis TaxID=8355 RepID=A0A1L8H1W5_XENLA|nr:olfactory receptor-like protein OLF3 [Xenopus laevis]OCT90090.1 hypothetical protein XELAEV_18018706mg [Xenopus laevis]